MEKCLLGLWAYRGPQKPPSPNPPNFMRAHSKPMLRCCCYSSCCCFCFLLFAFCLCADIRCDEVISEECVRMRARRGYWGGGGGGSEGAGERVRERKAWRVRLSLHAPKFTAPSNAPSLGRPQRLSPPPPCHPFSHTLLGQIMALWHPINFMSMPLVDKRLTELQQQQPKHKSQKNSNITRNYNEFLDFVFLHCWNLYYLFICFCFELSFFCQLEF